MDEKAKTIIAGFPLDAQWESIFESLSAADGPLDICYWVCNKPKGRNLEKTKMLFQNAVFHDVIDAIRSIEELNIEQPCLDEQQLIELSRFEPIAMQMMDRLDPDNCFSYSERKRHYHRLLKYWSAVLSHHKPTLVIFPSAPHMVYDYILYILARKSNIRTLMVNVNSALGRVMLGEDIDDFCAQVKHAYKNTTPICDQQETQIIDDHIKTLMMDYNAAKPHYMKMLEDNELRFAPSLNPLKLAKSVYWQSRIAGRQIKSYFNLKTQWNQKPPDNYLKKRGVPLEAGGYSLKEWQAIKNKGIRKKRNLKKQYESLVSNQIDLSVKYVYVPLHYQPETTTCPEGGYYANQILMIDLISTLIPDDWRIYVKEHYLQWQKQVSKGHQSRVPQDYCDLAAIPKVHLAPLSMNSFELMDSSRVLATVLGYAAWEAMVRGKPAFLFGAPWFGAHENAHLVKTRDDFIQAFEQIKEGRVNLSHEKTKAYLAAYFSVSFIGRTNKWNKDVTTLSDQQNTENFVRAFNAYLS
ncbi:MAG: hypothetical protein GKR96_02050 [Gammaproteobacteria bacterium]|nr:hypothetical protein [Gammaproteobacteria bacterium]